VEGFIEITFEVGPLPSQHELVAKFQTSINSGSFFTDDNGFEFLERQSSWAAPIASNFYPMVYASYIHDGISQLTLIGERSHGVASLQRGELEVMIHRNPDSSDGFGPGLTDRDVVFPTFRLLIDTPQNSSVRMHKQTYFLNFPLTIYDAPTTTAAIWIKTYKTSIQFLSSALPDNIHLVSLNALDATSNKVILRLTHLFAVGEDYALSRSVTLDVSKLFTGVKIASLVETTLTANKSNYLLFLLFS
jgi:alpha-mannosidase